MDVRSDERREPADDDDTFFLVVLRSWVVVKVDGSDRIGHHAYDPAGSASTIRADGDGPGAWQPACIICSAIPVVASQPEKQPEPIPSPKLPTTKWNNS